MLTEDFSCLQSLRRKLGRSKSDSDVLAVREAETKFTASTAELSHAIFSRSAQEIPHSFKLTVQSLVKTKSISQIGSGATTHYVDIVRDVINLLPIYWLSEEVVRISELPCIAISETRCRLASLSRQRFIRRGYGTTLLHTTILQMSQSAFYSDEFPMLFLKIDSIF